MRRQLSYANIAATLALVITLGGGVAFAADRLGKNAVKSKNIAPSAVRTSDLKDGAVTGAKVRELTLGPVPTAITVGGVRVDPIDVTMDDGQTDVVLVNIAGTKISLTCGNGGTAGVDARLLQPTSPTLFYHYSYSSNGVTAGRITTTGSFALQLSTGMLTQFSIREPGGAVTRVHMDVYRENDGVGTKDCFFQGTIETF